MAVAAEQEAARMVAMDAFLVGDMKRGEAILKNASTLLSKEEAKRIAHILAGQRQFDKATQVLLLSNWTEGSVKEELAEFQRVSGNPYALPAFYELVKHASDQQIWFKATEPMKKPGYKGLVVVWWSGKRKPDKAKQSTIQQIEISQGAYKQISKDALPPEVRARFEEV